MAPVAKKNQRTPLGGDILKLSRPGSRHVSLLVYLLLGLAAWLARQFQRRQGQPTNPTLNLKKKNGGRFFSLFRVSLDNPPRVWDKEALGLPLSLFLYFIPLSLLPFRGLYYYLVGTFKVIIIFLLFFLPIILLFFVFSLSPFLLLQLFLYFFLPRE